MSDRLPTAVLWDMDGTLVDTEPYWIACETALVTGYGGTWTTADAHAMVGNALHTSAAYLHEHGGVPLSSEEIIEHLLDGVSVQVQAHVPWRPGAVELLHGLVELGVPTALVTMSFRRLSDIVVQALPPGSFPVQVTGDQVSRGKPHPDPYLLAAERLGVEPGECVAIEDSPAGIASARAAGVPVIGVEHLVQLRPHTTGPVLHTLEGVSPYDLLPILAAQTPA